MLDPSQVGALAERALAETDETARHNLFAALRGAPESGAAARVRALDPRAGGRGAAPFFAQAGDWPPQTPPRAELLGPLRGDFGRLGERQGSIAWTAGCDCPTRRRAPKLELGPAAGAGPGGGPPTSSRSRRS